MLLPEITDAPKWIKASTTTPIRRISTSSTTLATATYGSISYNTKLVNVKDFKSYWDLLAQNGKEKLSRARLGVAGTGSGNARLFYYLPDVGPSYIKRLYGEMEVTLFRDYRQGTDWLAVGKAASAFSAKRIRQGSRACRSIHLGRACSKKARA